MMARTFLRFDDLRRDLMFCISSKTGVGGAGNTHGIFAYDDRNRNKWALDKGVDFFLRDMNAIFCSELLVPAILCLRKSRRNEQTVCHLRRVTRTLEFEY